MVTIGKSENSDTLFPFRGGFRRVAIGQRRSESFAFSLPPLALSHEPFAASARAAG